MSDEVLDGGHLGRMSQVGEAALVVAGDRDEEHDDAHRPSKPGDQAQERLRLDTRPRTDAETHVDEDEEDGDTTGG